MSDLTEFVLARIAETELHLGSYAAADRTGYLSEMLHREGRAMRKIVESHVYDEAIPGCVEDRKRWPCQTMLALAYVYADSEDFKREWGE